MFYKMILAGALTMTLPFAAAAQSLSHTAWNDILTAYVQESPDGLNRFDYGGLKANAADVEKLEAYIDSFADFDVDSLEDNAQFAAYANAYNALTIQHIIERYPLNSITDGYLIGPWKKVKMTINGAPVSLDAIEHEILREEFDEPRVHYAVNCASYGCPNLQAKAWDAETLDADLDAAAHDFINHPRGVTVRAKGGLQVSTIYKWFRKDFGGSQESLVAHFLEYAEPELATAIQANPKIKKHAYDWSLNDIEK